MLLTVRLSCALASNSTLLSTIPRLHSELGAAESVRGKVVPCSTLA